MSVTRDSARETAPLISLEDVRYTYDNVHDALAGVSLDVLPGEFLAVVGGNGSGKSTLAKHLNALLVPDEGRVTVFGLDTADPENVYAIRERTGMVFQNPDDQLVTSIVEDDVAFGPENLGLPPDEICRRVRDALDAVAMGAFAASDPMNLSGGQKQRVAIAGVLAMRPDVLVFDEPGAMLDPRGRRGILRVCHEMHASGRTIVLVTHFMDEALEADRVVVLHEGRVALQGTPREVFADPARLRDLDLKLPFALELRLELERRGVDVGDALTTEQVVRALCP